MWWAQESILSSSSQAIPQVWVLLTFVYNIYVPFSLYLGRLLVVDFAIYHNINVNIFKFLFNIKCILRNIDIFSYIFPVTSPEPVEFLSC